MYSGYINLLSIAKKYVLILKNLLFPARCDLCGAFIESSGLCVDCWNKISWISEPKCKICGIPFEIDIDSVCALCLSKKQYFDKIVSVFKYDEFSKEIIAKFKYYDATNLSRIFAQWIVRVAEKEISDSDLVITVPTHFVKRLRRKYNQSELLAIEICKITEKPYEPRVLKKAKHNRPQEGLSSSEREKNVTNTFFVNEKYVGAINNKNLILVDDVVTTGSTANECCKALKKHGAKSITIVTAARAVLNN
jgi:ComF family protein